MIHDVWFELVEVELYNCTIVQTVLKSLKANINRLHLTMKVALK